MDHGARSSPQHPRDSPSHPSTLARPGHALQLLNVRRPPTPQPISYPTPVPVLKGPRDLHAVDAYGQEHYDDEDEDEWDNVDAFEHEYVDIDSEPVVGMDPYLGVRPRQVHRESQDVEFAHRAPPAGRSRHGRGWDVNVRMPRMKRTRHLLSSLKVPHNLKVLGGGLRRTHYASHATPPAFEFREPQPVPQSVRQQYAELAPAEADAEIHKGEDGLLAPPRPTFGPQSVQQQHARLASADKGSYGGEDGLAAPPQPQTQPSLAMHGVDARNRRSRARSVSHDPRSQYSPRPPSHRSRSHSVGSRRSDETRGDTTVAPHSAQTHGGTAETTVVQHDSDPVSMYTYVSRQPSAPTSPAARRPPTAQESATLSSLGSVRPPNPSHMPPAAPRNKSASARHPHLAPVLRALQRLQRLPWVAQPENPPGALLPSGPTPRVAADFVPALSSARSRFRVRGKSAAGGKDGTAAGAAGSWYQPSAKQLQAGLRTRHAAAQAHTQMAGVGAVANAYQNYFATTRRHGRPLGYMYAPPVGRAASSNVSPPHASRSTSASTGSSYAYSYAIPMVYAPPTYSYPGAGTGSAYASQNTSQGSYACPPPVPPKQTQAQVQPQMQMQTQPQVMYVPVYVAPSTASSPPLPPLPNYVTSSSTGSAGSGYGTVMSHGAVPLKYVPYSYSYM